MTVFKNCSIVLPERVIPGYVVVEDGLIAEIDLVNLLRWS